MQKHPNIMRKLLSVVCTIATVLQVPLPLRAQVTSAIVTGHVSDDQSRPISGAKIAIFPMDSAVSGPIPSATTDENGNYRLVAPPFGRTRFCAVKEAAGYPNTQALLFVSGNESRPEVFLTPGARLQVDIHLGKPNGVVEGVVVDKKTHAPVPTARITLHRDKPEAMYSTSLPPDGHFLFALPSSPIQVSVTAPGYALWNYTDPLRATHALVLETGDHKILAIELTAK